MASPAIESRQEGSWIDQIGTLWCSFSHASATWPIHGKYACGVCGRTYPVPWESNSQSERRSIHPMVKSVFTEW
jgi:hypothetical protein